MAHMMASQEYLSQTQNMRASQLVRPTTDDDVFAKLVSLTGGPTLEIRRDKKEVKIGRHPSCDITTEDKRASATHLRIYRDDSFRFFIEELGGNGAWCNDHFMKKGEERALRHGDAISVCVHHADKTPGQEPFVAYIFRLSDHVSDPVGGCGEKSKGVGPIPLTKTMITRHSSTDQPQRVVTEEWINENWDMRTILGSGNFSEVRLGVQVKKAGGEKCAIKVIDKQRFYQFQSKRDSQLSLQSEAEMLKSLKCPGIIRCYEWFETEAKLYLAMEFLPGGDLLQCILEHGCFSEATAKRLFKQIAGAVRYLHEQNVVHRDLKPENILLSSKSVQDMVPKLADFGLARASMGNKDCKTFCGTPHYFAPEVIETFRDRDAGQPAGYGKQVDMWSLGVILYIMLSGIPPFEEEGLYEQIVEGKYEFDVQEWTKVSPEAKDLVSRLMVVNPNTRLTIQQTMQHKWFAVEETPTPPDNVREAKRRRTACGDEASMSVDSTTASSAITGITLAPLGS